MRRRTVPQHFEQDDHRCWFYFWSECTSTKLTPKTGNRRSRIVTRYTQIAVQFGRDLDRESTQRTGNSQVFVNANRKRSRASPLKVRREAIIEERKAIKV